MSIYYEEPLIDKIAKFFSNNSKVICVILGIVCSLVGIYLANRFNLQAVLFYLSFVYFVINLFLLWLSKRGKDVPAFVWLSRWALTLILIVVSIISIIVDKQHHVILPIAIIALCLINHGISDTYRDRWAMPNVLFKKLIKIEVLGVIIAALQLVVAFPNLKTIYTSVTKDDITELSEDLKEFNSHVENFIFVDIPDSLLNEEVIRAREFQKKIYAFSLFVINASWAPINIESVSKTLIPSNREIKTHSLTQDDLVNMLSYCFNYNNEISAMNNRLLAYSKGEKEFFEYITSVHEYYQMTADSTLLFCQIDKENYINYKDAQDNQLTLAKDINKMYERLTTIVRGWYLENNMIKRTNKIYKEYPEWIKQSEKVINSYNDVLRLKINSVKLLDNVCLDYIAFLNLIQLKYAYNLNLDLTTAH